MASKIRTIVFAIGPLWADRWSVIAEDNERCAGLFRLQGCPFSSTCHVRTTTLCEKELAPTDSSISRHYRRWFVFITIAFTFLLMSTTELKLSRKREREVSVEPLTPSTIVVGLPSSLSSVLTTRINHRIQIPCSSTAKRHVPQRRRTGDASTPQRRRTMV